MVESCVVMSGCGSCLLLWLVRVLRWPFLLVETLQFDKALLFTQFSVKVQSRNSSAIQEKLSSTLHLERFEKKTN